MTPVCVNRSVMSDCDLIHRQAPLSMEFSRQQYWSGLSFPSPGNLPSPGIELTAHYVSCIGKLVLYH